MPRWRWSRSTQTRPILPRRFSRGDDDARRADRPRHERDVPGREVFMQGDDVDRRRDGRGVSFHLDGHALLRAEDLAPDAAGACQDLGVLVDRRRVYRPGPRWRHRRATTSASASGNATTKPRHNTHTTKATAWRHGGRNPWTGRHAPPPRRGPSTKTCARGPAPLQPRRRAPSRRFV